MTDLLWRLVAWIVSRERIADWLVARAMRTPYTHIQSADGSDVYMHRWWLFNPFPPFDGEGGSRYPWCPFSVRVHHIHRPDRDRDLHDHPWNYRTIVLLGAYAEEREDGTVHLRRTGSTTTLRFGEYHRIQAVADKVGAVTLFITGRKRGSWGFKVDGAKVPWRQYLGLK